MTIDEAKAAGLKRYFTGKPCLRGHLSERFVRGKTCCQCDLERHQTAESREKQAASNAAYRHANPKQIVAYKAEYHRANRVELAAKNADYRKANTERIAAQRAEYRKANLAELAAHRKANPHIQAAINAKRRAAKLQATPSWADFEAIKAIYEQASFMSKVLGEKQHVDHMYPLISDEVCGLHVAANLQILSATDNIKKGNKLLPMYEMPEQAVE